MSYLDYISDNDLKAAVKKVIDCVRAKETEAKNDLYKNVVDPFSAIFDGVINGLSLDDWLEKEKTRQTQKSVQNKIGEFHENVLSSVSGWKKVPKGVDIRSMERKIIAEIKNKHNTVKGSDKVGIYDFLEAKLNEPQYQGFTAYYVEIIPSSSQSYDIPFIPSDRSSGQRRDPNQQIRKISGQAFYTLVTRNEHALQMLFQVLPDVISEVAGVNKFNEHQKNGFLRLFNRAY